MGTSKLASIAVAIALTLTVAAAPSTAAASTPEPPPPADSSSPAEPEDVVEDDFATPTPTVSSSPEPSTSVDDPAPASELVWLTSAPPKGNGASSGAIAPLSTANSGIPSAGWPGCGLFDDKFKVMKDYTRLRVSTKMSGTYGRLYCGIPTNEGSTSAFGYRHIKYGHETDWSNKAAYINRHWHDLAAWAISYTLRDPDRATEQTARFCFQRKFWLADQNGTVRSTMIVQVALGETGVRIMTAFPRNTGGCSGTQLYYARPS